MSPSRKPSTASHCCRTIGDERELLGGHVSGERTLVPDAPIVKPV
jgi:hypothetical protein